MMGDKLAGFQIAYSGKEITIRNVVIYEADPNDPGVSEKKNPAVSEYIKNRPATDFRQQNRYFFLLHCQSQNPS